MSEEEDVEAQNDNDDSRAPPAWLLASVEDAKTIDFESPIENATTADCYELGEFYRKAVEREKTKVDSGELGGKLRVYAMLSALTEMHFKPHDRNEPFGPMVTFANGRRSAIPNDFTQHIEQLVVMAERARNPVLRARLSDICWLLDRRRAQQAFAAISGYSETVQHADVGELKFRFQPEERAICHEACDLLRRALQIGRSVGWEKPEVLVPRGLVGQLREQAAETSALNPLHWFCDLDLDFGVSDAVAVGASIDVVLSNLSKDVNSHTLVDLWRLAARAYQLAKRDEDKNRCLAEAAEQLVAESESKSASAMLASHFLSSAIAQLHGIPGKKERRTELRHKLIDIQSRVPEEMSAISHELDLREIAERVRVNLGKADLLDMLLMFGALAISPDPEKLKREAGEAIRKHPLSSLFGTSHLDREGKVIHRTPSAGLGDDADSLAIAHQVAQTEGLRRSLVAFGQIETARLTVIEKHYLTEDDLASLLEHSAFVPSDLVRTFSRAFVRYFQGDFVSASYILIPLLENSLRHLLKASGHDVTIFDDATQTQQDRTISSLFEQMRAELEQILGQAITAEIERLFLSKQGPHLRHAVAHGLFTDGDPYGADAIYACWLIYRLCVLPLFPYQREIREMLPFLARS
jgi:hypothetical protein